MDHRLSSPTARQRTKTSAEIPYDIILDHIIPRLPLKYAARCRTLNKHFRTAITKPLLYALLSSPPPTITNSIILHHLPPKFTTIDPPNRKKKSLTLPTDDTLIDSCNGIVLFFDRDSQNYYLLNPFTGSIAFLNNYNTKSYRCGGLVVDNPSTSSANSFDFKLVELETKKLGARGHTRLIFRVFAPSSEGEMVMKEIYCDFEVAFTPLVGRNWRPVYGHGYLHWIGKGGTDIVAFDVESRWGRIMDGPVRNAIDCTCLRTWFGSGRGSLQFIRIDYSNREQISVHTHDYDALEWRVAHRIEMPDYMSRCHVRPVFFDGGRNVFFHMSHFNNNDNNNNNKNNVEEVYVYDLSVGKWEKSGEVEDDFDQRYVEFVPTMVRVSDVYLTSLLARKGSAKKGLCLLALQRLFFKSYS